VTVDWVPGAFKVATALGISDSTQKLYQNDQFDKTFPPVQLPCQSEVSVMIGETRRNQRLCGAKFRLHFAIAPILATLAY